MKRDRTWLTDAEIAPAKSAILCSVAIDSGASDATHTDVFMCPGHNVNRVLFVNPPQAIRLEMGKSISAIFPLPQPGPYTVYALPRRLDPTFRGKPVALAPVTSFVDVPPRPIAQEFLVRLG